MNNNKIDIKDMMKDLKKRLVSLLIISIMSGLLCACSNLEVKVKNANEIGEKQDSKINTSKKEKVKNDKKDNDKKIDIDKVIKEYRPNELGDIPVIMYHAVLEDAPTVYQRSVLGFKRDLQYMYDNNYQTISNRDYIDFNITVDPGKTPILLTFDDGEAGTFDLVYDDTGKLVPRKNTAIYLMEEFYKEHKDFGKNAILFINGHAGTFNDKNSDKTITLETKIKWLFDHGYEVSNHTSGHLNIKNSTISEVQKQIANVDKQIKKIKSDAKLDSIAYPFGAKPSSENEWIISNGSYDGYSYSYKVGFREGPSKPRFVPIISTNFEMLNAPRLRGNEGELGDMWSYFESYEKTPSLRFISDGDKDTITVPNSRKDEIDTSRIGNKKIVTYNSETLEIDK